jgi:hypothetical protein
VQRRRFGAALILMYLAAFGLKAIGWGDFLFVWVPIALGGLYALMYRAVSLRPGQIDAPKIAARG